MSTPPRPGVFCFAVQSDATPGSLPRVLEVFALHGLVPNRCHCQRVDADGAQLAIDLEVTDLAPAQAAKLAHRLGAIVTVSDVLFSEKQRALAA